MGETAEFGTPIKCYFAGAEQVAMRVDGELFLTPGDPTGIEQLLTDETGAEVGRIIYDSFGGVVTSTMPMTLTSAFAGLPDAASGLVHMGGGRWYDPAIGRPLQPNPTGGAPTAPQTMSRYAATPLGQPGVYEAATIDSLFVLMQSAGNQVPGLLGGLATEAMTVHLRAQTVYMASSTGFGIVQLEGSVRNMKFLDDSFETISIRSTWRNPLSLFFKGSRLRTTIGRA